ncbi:unnamed protein product [uncultured bacterium]|nr:unnamed protein product [uncultured bacterium]
MTDVEFMPLLEEAIRRTGVERYRFLCLEHPDAAVRDGYRRLVAGIAASPLDLPGILEDLHAAAQENPRVDPQPCGGCPGD